MVVGVLDDGFGQTELPASALANEEYRGCTASL
jgi:hypothetical protein